jgi:hypothetical protein
MSWTRVASNIYELELDQESLMIGWAKEGKTNTLLTISLFDKPSSCQSVPKALAGYSSERGLTPQSDVREIKPYMPYLSTEYGLPERVVIRFSPLVRAIENA